MLHQKEQNKKEKETRGGKNGEEQPTVWNVVLREKREFKNSWSEFLCPPKIPMLKLVLNITLVRIVFGR
jgi:hypothetical protein